MNRRIGLLAAAGFLAAVGCDSFLDVEQRTQPATEAVFQNDQDFEAALGSSFGVWWGVAQGSRPTNSVWLYPVVGMAVIAEELTMSVNDGEALEVGSEPRLPYDNDQQGGNWFMRKPFYDLYHCNAIALEALRFLNTPDSEGNTPVIGEPNDDDVGDHTERARTFAKFMMGLCQTYQGLLFDQGYRLDESIPNLRTHNYQEALSPYWEVTDFGIGQLEEAITMAEAAPLDTIPPEWFGRTDAEPPIITKTNPECVDCQTLVQLAHSFIARAYAYNARTPLQRRTTGSGIAQGHTDWAKVLEHAEQGIKQDFYVIGVAAANAANGNSSRFDSQYKRYTQFSSTARVDNRLVGPADTTGAYQAWLAADLGDKTHFLIKTPDRRVHGDDLFGSTGTLTTSGYKRQGLYFRPQVANCTTAERTARGQSAAECWNPNQTMNTSQGSHPYSIYSSVKLGTTAWNSGNVVTMTPIEMNFLMAEAHIRLGSPALAADLINNQGRLTRGMLPAVTVTGPPQSSAAEIKACVPKKADGTCGDLMDALMYEKRFETHALEALIPYADARGWGLMVPGSICMLAIPNREMETIGLASEVYSFGGDLPGSVGAEPRPNGAKCSD